ncbi:MAG: c-type cytochrome biogenesis protein CcmI [Halomonadaceae bacterium]|nr:MAG: c-type cytochrome biogenesis protein CcmI [Halomonadaceae bacterium]
MTTNTINDEIFFMTLTFWLALVLLVALALLFVVYPLFFRRGQGSGLTRQQQNLDAYRQRLEELEQERTAGVVDEKLFNRLKQEMEANLLDDVDDQEVAPPQGSRKLLLSVSFAASVLVPVLAFYLYGEWGAEERVAQTRLMHQMQSGEISSPSQMYQVMDELEARLARSPDNADGWLMLARSRMQMEQFLEAGTAYERLASLAGEENRKDAAVAWGLAAQGYFLAADGQINSRTREAINRARTLNPEEVNATGLLGIDAFQREEYRQAIDYWESVLAVAPDHLQGDSIRNGVAAAYTRLGEPVPQSYLVGAAASEPSPVATEGSGDASVRVSVQLSEQAQQEVPDDAVVFVYARAMEGPPRPLAISRLTVEDLPLELQLDDTMAMSPEDALSPGQEVMVIARVSLSGDASPQTGDWQGEAGPLRAGEISQPTLLRIDQSVR